MFDDRVLQLLWEKCEVGCCTVSEDGLFTHVNDKLCEILEYTEAELVGKHFKDITLPTDAGPDMEMARRVASGQVEHYRMVKTYIKKSGWPVQIELVVWPVKCADGHFEYFLSQIVPRVDVKSTQAPTTVSVEPGLILLRALAQNRKVCLAVLATTIALAGVATALFELLKHLASK